MHWKPREWTLIGMLLLAFPAAMTLMKEPAAAQSSQASTIATTTVTDTVSLADGTPASGTVLVSWTAFTTTSRPVCAQRNYFGDDYEWCA